MTIIQPPPILEKSKWLQYFWWKSFLHRLQKDNEVLTHCQVPTINQNSSSSSPLPDVSTGFGKKVWKSAEMWGTCSSFSLLILWNFSFKPKKMCLRCGPNQPVLGLLMARVPAWLRRMKWELGPSCHHGSLGFIVYQNHLEGPTPGLLMLWMWGEAWIFTPNRFAVMRM